MTTRLPRQALLFTRTFAQEAARYGLRKGAARASAAANPALLVIEAAGAVLGAVDAYLQLRTARERRDGLARLIPLEEERLGLERDRLRETVEVARRELAQHRQVRQRIGELAVQCARVYGGCWDELQAIRRADLPDIEAFDTTLERLEQAQAGLRRGLALFNSTVS